MSEHDRATANPQRFSTMHDQIIAVSNGAATEDRVLVCTSLSDDDAVRQANKQLPVEANRRWGLKGDRVEACGRWPDSHRHLWFWR